MKFADRVKQTTTSTSSAIIVLSGTVATFGTFPAAFEVGTTGIVACTDDGKGAWEISAYTLTNASTLTRTAILSSSNNGAAVTFAAGVKEVFSTLPAAALAEFLRLSDGVTVAGLPRGVPQSTDLFPFARAAGGDLAITYGDFLALVNGNPPASDTTGPSFPDALTSSAVTQNGFTLAWQAATDASGIARYEYSYDGSTWTTAGTALSVVLTGRTAGTTYTMRVRAVDPSGNASTVRTLAVTTSAATGDTQAPTMSGSIITSAVTSTGYTFGWSAAADNVGIDHYESSIDGGANWESSAAGTLSRIVTGRPASTTDNLRVRAHDAAGNISNVLTGTVTTSGAAPVVAYNISGLNGNAVKATIDASAAPVSGSQKYIDAGATSQTTVGIYWNITAVSGGAKPASARSGWFPLGYTPTAADFITAAQNQSGATSVNGLRPMNPATGNAFGNLCLLWVQVGAGTVTMCYWICGDGGAPVCMNPSGTTITGV